MVRNIKAGVIMKIGTKRGLDSAIRKVELKDPWSKSRIITDISEMIGLPNL